jgi:hypothetical protein
LAALVSGKPVRLAISRNFIVQVYVNCGGIAKWVSAWSRDRRGRRAVMRTGEKKDGQARPFVDRVGEADVATSPAFCCRPATLGPLPQIE